VKNNSESWICPLSVVVQRPRDLTRARVAQACGLELDKNGFLAKTSLRAHGTYASNEDIAASIHRLCPPARWATRCFPLKPRVQQATKKLFLNQVKCDRSQKQWLRRMPEQSSKEISCSDRDSQSTDGNSPAQMGLQTDMNKVFNGQLGKPSCHDFQRRNSGK